MFEILAKTGGHVASCRDELAANQRVRTCSSSMQIRSSQLPRAIIAMHAGIHSNTVAAPVPARGHHTWLKFYMTTGNRQRV